MRTTVKVVKPNAFNYGEDWKDYFVKITRNLVMQATDEKNCLINLFIF